MNKRILYSGLSILTTLTFMSAGTFAYFSDAANSATNTFSTGNIEVEVNQTANQTANVSNMAPGEENVVEFDVKNTGTLPFHLKAFASGAWLGFAEGNPSAVKVTRVEYSTNGGSDWSDLITPNPAGITGEVVYGPTGLEAGGFSIVPASATINFRLTVKLDENAGNEYELKTYEAKVHVLAKQVSSPTWPTPIP